MILHSIEFYKDKNGKEPVLDYMRELNASNSKDARIKLQKTPKREIEQAKREFKDYLIRSETNE